MKTITRCPGCHTAFLVQREQLEAREGRVRCGACGTVFDARVSLEVLEPSAAPITPSPPERGDEVPKQGDELFEEPSPIVLDVEPAAEDETLERPGAQSEISVQPAADDDATLIMPKRPRVDVIAPEPRATEKLEEPLFVEEQGEGDDAIPAAEEASPADDASTVRAAAVHDEPIFAPDVVIETEPAKRAELEEVAAPSVAPAFAAQAQEGDPQLPDFAAERRERQRLTRTWALACAPVALLLALQAALHWRAELGALAPGARWLLVALCAPFGCDVDLPQHAEMLALEGTHLEADAGGALTLYATLRNRARYEQSLPAIELTLTDPRDQPVARRLLTPRDYAPAQREGIPPGGELPVKVALDATTTRASGFRAEAVYP